MTLRAASAYNGFLPSATGQVISHIRDVKKFKVSKYAQYIESPATIGVYYRVDRNFPVRVVTDADFVWADGADRPVQHWNQTRWELVEFAVKRRNYGFTVGHMAIDSAKRGGLDIVGVESGATASQAMVNRTNRVITLLETTSNWGSNTKTANELNEGAGNWLNASDDPTSPNYNAIKKTLLGAALEINVKTNGAVTPDMMNLVISPELASGMANTPEVHNYLKFGPFSKAQLEENNANALWGLPPSLYGFELIVEDAVRVSSRPGASDTYTTDGTRAYVKSPDSALLVSRVGGIDGIYGSKNFSTVQLYWYEYEMAVEVFDDPENKRLNGNVVDCFAEILAAPESGYLITGTRS